MKPKKNFSRILSILLVIAMLSGIALTVPVFAATTGWLSPTAGDNTGVGGSIIEADIPKAFDLDGNHLTFGSNNERAAFYGFGATAVPAGSTVTGIEVALTGYRNNSENWQVSLSYNGGTNWTSPAIIGGNTFGSTDSTQIIGGTTETWSYSPWTAAIINSNNFRVRLVSDNMSGGTKLIALEHIQVRFTYTAGTHTVTWKTQDGTSTYETDTNVPFGTQPDYNGSVPVKAATAEFTYTFAGWSTSANQTSGTAEASLPAVSGDVIYYAAFSSSTNNYSVTWKTQDGTSTYETDLNVPYGTYPDYNGAVPAKAATAEFTYTFAGWSTSANDTAGTAEASLPAVSGDVIYYAAFSSSTNNYSVTWKTQDGTSTYETDLNVPYGTYPDYNGAAPAKAATAEFTYTFAGWSTSANQTSGTAEASLPAISGDVIYYAAFSSSTNNYSVTWKTQDGTSTYETDLNVPYGTYPDYNGAVPAKAATAEFTYTFAGWSTSANQTSGTAEAFLPAVSGDVIYYAAFSSSTNNYSVTWKTQDGTSTYETDLNVPYGTQPDYNGALPAKASDEQYEYTFAGWSTTANDTAGTAEASLPAVSDDVTYYAVFTASLRSYTVIWKTQDGTSTYETDLNVPYASYPDYNGALPVKVADAQYTYTFAGWSTAANQTSGTAEASLQAISGDVTYYAAFSASVNAYTVIWKNFDGTSTYETDLNVPYGTQPGYSGAEPVRTGTPGTVYTFIGWSTAANDTAGSPAASLPAVSGDVIYYAVFTPVTDTYTVIWKNETGTSVYETDTGIPSGTYPDYNGAAPSKPSTLYTAYTFAGWSTSPHAASGTPESSLPPVTENVIYYAVFTPSPICYTVTWKNEAGTSVYETDSVPFGILPDYNGLTPSKTATAQYTYIFAGWSTAANDTSGTPELFLPPVTENITYYAVFTACINKYTVTWINGAATLETDLNVPYGTQPDYNGAVPAKAASAQYTYIFAGWSTTANAATGTAEASLPPVTENAVYYAIFTAVTNNYTVTWKNGNTVLETDLNVPYGTLPAYNGAMPQKAPVYGKTYTFIGWSATVNGQAIVLPAVTGSVTYYAVFRTNNFPFVFPILPIIPVVPVIPVTPPAPVLNLDDHFAYIVGYPDGRVRPGGNITREEAATVFFRLLSDVSRSNFISHTNPFSDVDISRWSNTAISTLYNAGILKGDGGIFRPADKITRAELAAIIAHFAAVTENTVPLTDIDGHWAQTSIELAAGNGWIVGYTDGSFRPDQFITRAETMAMVNRALSRKVSSTADLLPDMKTWIDNGDPGRWYYFEVQEATNSHTYERRTANWEKWLAIRATKDWASLEF